jgi:hypothetical protein
MIKKLTLLMTATTILYGASSDNLTKTIYVRHVNSDGIQGTYIFRDIAGRADMHKRCESIMRASPHLTWEYQYDEVAHSAWLISSKK